jgi:Kdo2-lipid IVA lauroyltransferase/acyltransferase
VKNILEYIFFIVFANFIRILPLNVGRRFVISLSYILFYIFRYRKGVLYSNLKTAFPDKPDKEITRIAIGSLKSFLLAIFETLWIQNLSSEKLLKIVEFKNPDVFKKLLDQKKGIIILTAHMGNWEYMGHAISVKFNIRYPAIAKPMRNTYINSYLEKLRKKFNVWPAYMDTGIKEVYKTILGGGAFALLADQSAPKESIYVDFMGRPAATFQGPAVFTLKSKAKLVFVVTIRQKDLNYEAFFEEIKTDDLVGTLEENILELTKRHVAMLEKYIRKYPDQWLWSHRRWKHTDEYLKNLENNASQKNEL